MKGEEFRFDSITPPKTNMTQKKYKHLKTYLLFKIVIFHRHVSLLEGRFDSKRKKEIKPTQILRFGSG